MALSGARLIPAVLIGLPLVVGLGAADVMFSEQALVKVLVAPQRVQVDGVALSGTTQLTASVTESQQAASSQVAVPATVASGRVTFWCSPMTSCPNGYTVAAGTLLESAGGAEYTTLSTVSFPSCAPSSSVSVTALRAGTAGNASAGAVAYGRLPSYIHVTNPWPVGGGTDAHSVSVIEQSDVDAVVKQLIGKVDAELPGRLQATAGGLQYLTTGAPSLTTGGSYRVGANSPAFTVQVTGTLTGVGFRAGDARELMRQALSRQVPSGYQLASNPISATYSMRVAAGSSEPTVTGSAFAYMIRKIDAGAVTHDLRGQSLTAAAGILRRVSRGGIAQIRTSPASMPWLPMTADRISLSIVVDTQALIQPAAGS